jgi:hypothetical protein
MTNFEKPSFHQEFEAEQTAKLGSCRQNWEEIVTRNINAKLSDRLQPSWSGNDDDIFGSYTALVAFSIKHFDPLPPILLWENRIAPGVERAESLLASGSMRIHKGSPLFNTGVAYYVAGDFERALAYVGEAGEEDQKSGHPSKFPILIGDHPLSRRFLIEPIVKRFFPTWAPDYFKCTGVSLEESEFISLLKYLAKRPADAVQLLLPLHRFLKVDLGFENHATKHIRTRAVAESLVALESTLRRFQTGVIGELGSQLDQLIAANSILQSTYKRFDVDFRNKWPSRLQKRSSMAVNWCTTEARSRFASATTTSERAGIACYLSYRLRNSLLHVVEESLDIFQQKSLCEWCMALALAAIRLANHGEDSTLAAL